MSNSKKDNIELIKRILGVDDSVIRAIGVGPLMTQVAKEMGMEGVTRCDADSGDTRQYIGDLEKDIKRRGGGMESFKK